MITQERLKELLSYDPETGLFTWITTTGNRAKAGTVIQCVNGAGYVQVKLDGKTYLVHRLAFLYLYGMFPAKAVDHINGVTTDNCISNLREASVRENSQNFKKHREGRLVGASFSAKQKKWKSGIMLGGIKYYLGSFPTEQLAHEAYLNALTTFNKAS